MDCISCAIKNKECQEAPCDRCKYRGTGLHNKPCIQCNYYDCKFIPKEDD